MRVAYPAARDAAVLDALEALLAPGLLLDRDAEAPRRCAILIDGRPEQADLDANDVLKSVVIPFAGVPRVTAEMVAAKPGVTLHNLHHNAPETAETALALLLAAARDTIRMDRALRNHDWRPRYEPSRTVRLEGKVALVLGFGAIGRRIAASCAALGMEVHAVRRRSGESEPDGAVSVHPATDLDELLPRTDALLIALPHTNETDGLIGKERLARLRPGAILVNVARAQIVDEEALWEALSGGHLHSAGLDVWYRYPHADAAAVPGYFHAPAAAASTPPANYPFETLDNVVMSPHRGGTSAETETYRIRALAELLVPAAEGKPMANRIDLALGY
ncbi:MAG: NAD(P)-binding domain-containing protein [Fimbriimonadaceae bacterium]|nr:NAD(P)-binding domain-containing protein [Fimbriimonadaceae bacterium]